MLREIIISIWASYLACRVQWVNLPEFFLRDQPGLCRVGEVTITCGQFVPSSAYQTWATISEKPLNQVYFGHSTHRYCEGITLDDPVLEGDDFTISEEIGWIPVGIDENGRDGWTAKANFCVEVFRFSEVKTLLASTRTTASVPGLGGLRVFHCQL